MPVSSKQRLVLTSTQPLAAEDVVVWNWPLRDEGLQSWVILVGTTGLVAAVWAIWNDLWFTLLTCATLAVVLWRLWLPVKWELGLTGVTLTVLGFRRRIPWMAVARFDFATDGVWLYADREGSPQRGTFIAYAGQRERIIACVNYYLGTWTAASESTQSFQ